LREKGLNAKNLYKESFFFTVGSVGRIKRFSLWSKRFADDEDVETEVLKSETTGFVALV
jgi:hypothetical protein